MTQNRIPYKCEQGGYQFSVSRHAEMRWLQRFPKENMSIIEHLERSRRATPGQKKKIKKGCSQRTVALMQSGSGMFYRVHQGIVFVMDNLHVVTIFPLPTEQ